MKVIVYAPRHPIPMARAQREVLKGTPLAMASEDEGEGEGEGEGETRVRD